MAKINDPDLAPLYAAAELFVDNALRKRDSLFTPGTAIWTDAQIADLHERMVINAEYSSASFLEKLNRQLQGASPTTIQFAAELLFVHLLPGKSPGGERKRDLLGQVLSWSTTPTLLPDGLAMVLDHHLAGVGPDWNTGQPNHLEYLMKFLQTWWIHSQEDRERALIDPWSFKSIASSVQVKKAQSQAQILLHLVHPDSFEPI
jgi:5-methylcytosine-specific restriction protein B